MVASKSMHIGYNDLCLKCRDNAKLEGKIVVKKLCSECKRTYWNAAANKAKEYSQQRSDAIEMLPRNKGNIVSTQMKATASMIRKQIKEYKVIIMKENGSIKKIKEQLKLIKNLKVHKKTINKAKKEISKFRLQIKQIKMFLKVKGDK